VGDAPTFMIKGNAHTFVMGDGMGNAPAFVIKGDAPLETRVSFTVTEPPQGGVHRQDQLEQFLVKQEHNQHT
jgi:hypothetical protein